MSATIARVESAPGVAPDDRAPEATYRERCARFAALRDAAERRQRAVSYARLAVFVLAVTCGLLGFFRDWPPGIPLAWAGVAAFVVLVLYHERVHQQRRRYAELWRIDDEAVRRVARDWDSLPAHAPVAVPERHPYAGDLDLFGHASLFQLLGSVATPRGAATLAAWLAAPAPPETVRERQAAVVELAPRLDLRDELTLQGRLMGTTQPDPEPFLAWAEDAPWLIHRPWLVWLSRLLPVATLLLLAAWIVGLLPYPLWLAGVVGNVILDQVWGGRVDRILSHVAGQAGAVQHYAVLFDLLAGLEWQSPALRRLQQVLVTDGVAAQRQARSLGWRVRLTYMRLSQFYLPVQWLTLWSFHTLVLLERWQQAAGPHVRGWLASLGEVEALAALAGLAHDNPDWTFPELAADDSATFEARALAHPLLPAAGRMANDVTVGPAGTVLVVTGSNMSGKSTLLRAIGVNVVLAQAGGPVCAEWLRLPPLTLHTSMRIQDSLAQGVSYFMAELQDLKRVVDSAEAARASGGPTLLYLLDEILQGTNTAERQVASRQILLHLVAQGAIGAVSTHDLTLADDPALAVAARPIHFTESFERTAEGTTMTFDYRLRPGPSTSTNALRLMELVGLKLAPPRQ